MRVNRSQTYLHYSYPTNQSEASMLVKTEPSNTSVAADDDDVAGGDHVSRFIVILSFRFQSARCELNSSERRVARSPVVLPSPQICFRGFDLFFQSNYWHTNVTQNILHEETVVILLVKFSSGNTCFRRVVLGAKRKREGRKPQILPIEHLNSVNMSIILSLSSPVIICLTGFVCQLDEYDECLNVNTRRGGK